MSDDTETIVIDIIKPNSKPFAMVVSYRPPESDPDMDLSVVYVVRKVAIKTKSRHRIVNIRSMKNFNIDRFKNELTSLPWSLVDNLENANDRWELWKSMFMNVVDNHAPLKRKRLRNSLAECKSKTT
ncbi:115 kDa [Paramuricea clavata]|uniref:115 kDa n=1 Tax=Paramuricea clavata TaxID=317549 RepID=A0A6S7H029_PARCT|nr:115 kDa [Paramuricea clavata]